MTGSMAIGTQQRMHHCALETRAGSNEIPALDHADDDTPQRQPCQGQALRHHGGHAQVLEKPSRG